MDEETRVVSVQSTSVTARDATDVAPLAAGELAEKIVAALDAIAARIPDLRAPQPKTAKRVRSARTVPREAVVVIIDAIEAVSLLQRLCKLDPDDMQEEFEALDALRLVNDRLAMLQSRVRYTIEARWAELVSPLIHAYTVGNTVADERDPDLLAHLANIRRHPAARTERPGRGRARRRTTPISGNDDRSFLDVALADGRDGDTGRDRVAVVVAQDALLVTDRTAAGEVAQRAGDGLVARVLLERVDGAADQVRAAVAEELANPLNQTPTSAIMRQNSTATRDALCRA
jgi:hypothetical protein